MQRPSGDVSRPGFSVATDLSHTKEDRLRPSPANGPRSLNFIQQKMEFERIDHNNKRFHARLKSVKPTPHCTFSKLKVDFEKQLRVRRMRDLQSSRFTDLSKVKDLVEYSTR